MSDQIVRAITKDGFVKATAMTSTAIVERARQTIAMAQEMGLGREDA